MNLLGSDKMIANVVELDAHIVSHEHASQIIEDKLANVHKDIVVHWDRSDFKAINATLRNLAEMHKIRDETLRKEAGIVLKNVSEQVTSSVQLLGEQTVAAYGEASAHERALEEVQELYRGINKNMEKLRLAERVLNSELVPAKYEDDVARQMKKCTSDKTAQFLGRKKASKKPMEIMEIVDIILSLYAIPSQVSNEGVKQHAHKCIEQILNDCLTSNGRDEPGSLDFVELGRMLTTADDAVGGEIIDEFPQFKM